MSFPYEKTAFGNKQLVGLENINRGINPNQQVAVYVPPKEQRTQNGIFQGEEMEDMLLGRK